MRALLFVVFAACAATPAARAPLRRSPPSRCTLVVVSDAKAAVARLGGGAFVLRRDGALERYARDGARTGAVPTDLSVIAPAGPYVCGAGPGGIACFRDRHEDLACRSSPFAPDLAEVVVPAGEVLAGDPDRPRLTTARGVWEISGTCGQHCVRLGCDGPLSCIDPCPPGDRPRLLARFLSNPGTPEVTHPSK